MIELHNSCFRAKLVGNMKTLKYTEVGKTLCCYVIFLVFVFLNQHISKIIDMCMSDCFRITRNCGRDSSPHSGRLSEEKSRTKEKEPGTWEGKASTDMLLMTGYALRDHRQAWVSFHLLHSTYNINIVLITFLTSSIMCLECHWSFKCVLL